MFYLTEDKQKRNLNKSAYQVKENGNHEKYA